MARRNVRGKAGLQFGRRTKKGVVECPECGSKFPVYRMSQRVAGKPKGYYKEGHKKDLYCYVCKRVTKHTELPHERVEYDF